ncbi:MAG TPA: N-acetylmuramoyl-L-alanine amidase [Coriobacteriia bacterium]
MTRETRNPSAARIATTLGAVVAAVMLAIWGASAIAGAMHGELKPEPKLKSVTTRVVTPTVAAVASAAVSAAETVTAARPAAPKAPAVKAPAQAAVVPAPSGKFVVVIDPGHQGSAYASSGKEPQYPGGPADYPKTHDGATGVNGVRESLIVLKVGLKLKPLLEAQGVKVIMTRTSENVTISNKERAEIADNAHADLFLRLHCDGVDGSSGTRGISMQEPANSGWPAANYGRSRKAGQLILSALVSATGAVDRGIAERSDLAGFNWCKVPVALPEMGFLSNSAEADKLASDSYQNTLARALADGTMRYLRSSR